MKIQLEQKDIVSLAHETAKKIEEHVSNTAIFKTLEERLIQLVNHHADYYLSENTLKHDVKDVVKLIVSKHIEESKVVEYAIADYFNSDSFKKVSIQQMERRIEQMRREIEREAEE